MQAKDIKLLYTDKEIEIHLTLDRNNQVIQEVSDLKKITDNGKLLDIKIKQHRKRRSLDANSYAWILADKIAAVIGNTKEFVYAQAIRTVGVFEILPIKDDALERWAQVWEGKGIGWQCEVMRESKLEGYTTTRNYYGSSVYDTKEFSRLLEEIIYQAKELNIETMTPNEQAELMSTWGSK